MFRLSVIGRLGADATMTEVGNMRVINFTVAVKDKSKKDHPTVWLYCSYWRKPDQISVLPFLIKGKEVFVQGTPSARIYVSKKTGEQTAAMDLNVSGLQLIGGKQ